MRLLQNSVLLFPFLWSVAMAQGPDSTDYMRNDMLENLVQEAEANAAFNTSYEILEHYYAHKLDLNRAKKADLQELGLLTDLQVTALLDYREKAGKLLTIYELQAVPHYDLATIRRIRPFITLRETLEDYRGSLKEMVSAGQHAFFLRSHGVLEQKRGFSPPDTSPSGQPSTRYLGSPVDIYTRYRYRYRQQISWGFTARKSAGEPFFREPNKRGFDFYSAHLYFRTNTVAREVALGDYHLRFGQGLIMWSGWAFGKTPFVMNFKRAAPEIRPYTSAHEAGFMRGAAVKWGHGNWHLTTFVSRKRMTASIVARDPDTGEPSVISANPVQQNGFHRTPADFARKNVVGEAIYGAHLAYETHKLKVGSTVMQTYLDLPSVPFRDHPYNRFRFAGQELLQAGVDYSYVWRNINLFGETAWSNSEAESGVASVNGAMMSLHENVDVGLLYRYLQRDYQGLYHQPFSEFQQGVNEQGLYLALILQPHRHWRFSGYFDHFKHPWLRYLVDAPSYGYDYMSEVSFEPSKALVMYLRYRQRQRLQNVSEHSQPLNPLEATYISRLRYHIQYRVADWVTLRNRFELSRYREGAKEYEHGYLIYQDVILRSMRFPVSLTGRLAYFDTESYNSAIWAFENDVLYYFSIPPYFYRGYRYYAVLRYQVSRTVDLWLRFSRTYYTNRETIGTGLEQIAGNKRSDIRAQMRLRF